MTAKALIVVARYLGDTLLALPIADALNKKGYATEWLVPPASAKMLAEWMPSECVHVLAKDIMSLQRLVRRLAHRFDLACVVTPTDRVMTTVRFLAKHVFAILHPRWQEWWKRRLVEAWIEPRPDRHVVAEGLALARLAGADAKGVVHIPLDETSTARIGKMTAQWKRPFIAVHPFARYAYKRWPVEHWQKLLQALVNDGFAIAVTGAPEERRQAHALVHEIPHVHVLAGEMRWSEIAALYAQASLYIGLDTANTHLAAAIGARIVALFGPTDPRRWGPWPNGFTEDTPWRKHSSVGLQRRGGIVLLQGKSPCVPCHREGCNRNINSRSHCLDHEIQPEDVHRAIKLALEER